MSATIHFTELEPITVKSPATITGQLKKLRERGCIIDDEAKARRTLETINYFRLVHYFAVFLENKGKYKEGTRFDDVIRIYDFDRLLRAQVLVILEETEIAFRAAVSNYHAVKYGAVGYLNADSFDRRHNHRVFMNKIERMVEKNSDLSIVRHHNKKYGGALPLWVMMEMFSFGSLVFFFQDMNISDKKEISDYYFKQDYRLVDNWLEYLSDLRNHCAHYNRVYGNLLPKGLRSISVTEPREYETGNSLFDYLLVIKQLHKREESWGSSFVTSLGRLFFTYKDDIDLRVLGFPEDWKEFLGGQLHE
ncbi:MAG: Abi family protein [Oscillospiraceae bacterium]|nr:Abi family protein [Oscillospiraceae bacterium]